MVIIHCIETIIFHIFENKFCPRYSLYDAVKMKFFAHEFSSIQKQARIDHRWTQKEQLVNNRQFLFKKKKKKTCREY